jgi:hypothetical protein
MRTTSADEIAKIKSTRKLLVTLAISAPIAFWMIWLLT